MCLENSFYILDISPSLGMWLADILSQSVVHFSVPSTVSFVEQEFLILKMFDLSGFFFPITDHVFDAVSTNPLPNLRPQRSVIIGLGLFLYSTFKSMIHFEFIFV